MPNLTRSPILTRSTRRSEEQNSEETTPDHLPITPPVIMDPLPQSINTSTSIAPETNSENFTQLNLYPVTNSEQTVRQLTRTQSTQSLPDIANYPSNLRPTMNSTRPSLQIAPVEYTSFEPEYLNPSRTRTQQAVISEPQSHSQLNDANRQNLSRTHVSSHPLYPGQVSNEKSRHHNQPVPLPSNSYYCHAIALLKITYFALETTTTIFYPISATLTHSHRTYKIKNTFTLFHEITWIKMVCKLLLRTILWGIFKTH